MQCDWKCGCFLMFAAIQVMRDPSGVSKGSGFVAFSNPEEASRAVCSLTILIQLVKVN